MSKEREGHAPSPWKKVGYFIVDADGFDIGKVIGSDRRKKQFKSAELLCDQMMEDATLMTKAPEMAEEIQRLKTEIAEKDKRIEELDAQINNTRERYKKVISELTEMCHDFKGDAEKAEKRVGELEGAIRQAIKALGVSNTSVYCKEIYQADSNLKEALGE
jgi:chromosome segregation ATPase